MKVRTGLVDPRNMANVLNGTRNHVRVWAAFGFVIMRETKQPRMEVRQ